MQSYNYKAIFFYRERIKKTQQECADCCGVKAPQWQRWEKGITIPMADSLGRIAHCLGVNVCNLYKFDYEMNNLELDDRGVIK
jgi:transcriptional regulator with XRE-family HTH domain